MSHGDEANRVAGACIVYVVDDDGPSRQSVAALVGANAYPTETFASGDEFLQRYDGTSCAIVISDYRMPGMDGLELQKRLVDVDAPVPVIVVSGYADVPTAVRALRNGAVTLLEKPYEPSQLIRAVDEAIQVANVWFDKKKRLDDARAKLGALKEAERQVMEMVLGGVPNKTIAARLDLSLRTVERRRHDILKKLGAETLVELAEVVNQAHDATVANFVPRWRGCDRLHDGSQLDWCDHGRRRNAKRCRHTIFSRGGIWCESGKLCDRFVGAMS